VKKPEYEKFAGYFNLDNGTGKVRGVYLQGNETVRPIFREWLAPFREMGDAALTISNTGCTDHLSFDGIGLPASSSSRTRSSTTPVPTTRTRTSSTESRPTT
jgi:hypothetical protein